MPYQNGDLHTSKDGSQFMFDATSNKWLPVPSNYTATHKTPETDIGAPANVTAKDAVRGITETGPVKMISGLVGAPADALELGAQAHDAIKQKAGEWLGYDPGPAREPQPAIGGSPDVQKGIEANILGRPTYQPETGVGNIAARTSEFATNPLTYLGGGEASFMRPFTRGLAPAMSGEAASKATDDPYVGLAATMLGPAVGRRMITPFPARTPAHAADAKMVAKALHDSGSDAKVSAGKYGNPTLAAIENRAGMPEKFGQDALDRGFTRAQFDLGGVPGKDNLIDFNNNRTHIIPRNNAGTGELNKVGRQMEAFEQNIPPQLRTMMGDDNAQKAAWLKANSPGFYHGYEDARKRYAHLSDMDKAGQTGSIENATGHLTPGGIVNQMPQDTPGHKLGQAAQRVMGPQKETNIDAFVKALGMGLGGLGGASVGNLYGLGAGGVAGVTGAHYGGKVAKEVTDLSLKALGKTGLLSNPVTQAWMRNQGIPGTTKGSKLLASEIYSSPYRNPDED